MVHPGAPGGKLRTQNRAQPTASDSSDQLFFIRKMRCEGRRYAFGVKFSSAPTQRQALRARCTPAQDRAAVAKKWVRTPILGRFGRFFGPRKRACFHAVPLNTGRSSRFNLRCGVPPPRCPSRHTHRRKTSYQTNIRQAIAGFWRLGYCRD